MNMDIPVNVEPPMPLVDLNQSSPGSIGEIIQEANRGVIDLEDGRRFRVRFQEDPTEPEVEMYPTCRDALRAMFEYEFSDDRADRWVSAESLPHMRRFMKELDISNLVMFDGMARPSIDMSQMLRNLASMGISSGENRVMNTSIRFEISISGDAHSSPIELAISTNNFRTFHISSGHGSIELWDDSQESPAIDESALSALLEYFYYGEDLENVEVTNIPPTNNLVIYVFGENSYTTVLKLSSIRRELEISHNFGVRGPSSTFISPNQDFGVMMRRTVIGSALDTTPPVVCEHDEP